MMRLSTKIYFFAENENGAGRDLASGIRPNFGIQGDLITSQLDTFDDADPIFRRGFWTVAKVSLPYGEIYGDAIQAGTTFFIQVGNHRIGVGVVDEVLEVFHEPKNAGILEEYRKTRGC